MDFDWKKVVGAVAPALGTALGGPLGGMAVSAISGALLGKPDAGADEIAQALTAGGPEALLKLKEADQAFAAHMRELDIDLERLRMSDRANARDREVKTGDSWTPRVLAGIFVAGWFAVQWYLLQHVVPTEMREIIMRTLGTLDMGLGLILGYYFGSSASSKAKDDVIARSSVRADSVQ